MSTGNLGGSGSVYQRKDGYWCAAVSLGSRRIVRYTRTEREAKVRLQELLREYHLGTLAAPTKVNLSEWVGQWLDQIEADLRASTVRTYRQVLEPVVREVGHVRLDRLTAAMLTDVFTRLRRRGMGPRRVQLAHGYLKACLERAVDLDLLGGHPMAKVPRPRWEAQTRRYWTVEEAARFVDTALASQTKWAPLLVVLATCGLRVSEALGLTWREVDLERRALRVERALVWAGNRHVLGPVKTKAALREITLPEVAVRALEQLPPHESDDEPLFRTGPGKAPRPDHLRDPMGDLCKRAGVPKINIHGLRHVHAVLGLKAGADMHDMQRRLGHSKVTTTMGIYAYAIENDAEVADAVGRLLVVRRPTEGAQDGRV